MKGLALVIGNSVYEQTENNLKNPENDATDFSDVLKRLGFVVKSFINTDLQTLDTQIAQFGKDLDNYDIGIFYFAGHGMQIDGENFITSSNTNFETETSAQYSSITLNKILAYMERAKNETNIVILDACRNNPFERSWNRSLQQQGLAPMYAPKGTLIAYATSPGEKASDGIDRNGLYTSAILKHIEDDKISIEELFKRVRNSVFAFSNGKQTTWEHTSLTGTFIFNSGQLAHSIKVPYSTEAILDKNFTSENPSEVFELIQSLKSYDYYTQGPAISKIKNIKFETADKNELFVLGRNILQTAQGGEFRSMDIIKNLDTYFINNEAAEHILNGILFEMYFDSSGLFRYGNVKNAYLDEIYRLEKSKQFKKSFEFIKSQLEQFEQSVFFIPGSTKKSVGLDVILKKYKSPNGKPIYNVQEVKHEGQNVLVNDNRNPFFGDDDDQYYESLTFSRLPSKISELSSIPENMLTVATNHDLKPDSRIGFPFGFVIDKSNKN